MKNRLRLLFMFWLILLPSLSLGAEYGFSYGYPIPDAYSATILGTPDELKPKLPDDVPFRELVLELDPALKKPDIFFYDNGLRCLAAYQYEKAPLVFLVAGTGASSKAPKLVSMARQLYKAGFHVITISSPTHPNFIINASRSHVPGDLTEDAADLYLVMEKAWKKAKREVEISDFYLAGYSLGGTEAAFVAYLDESRKKFNFRKVLMINPAVNLYDSVSRIEALLNNIPGGPKKIGAFMNSILAKFVQFYQEGEFVDLSNEFLYAVYQAQLLNHDEAGGVIGLSFRINSAGMIFVSDVMTNGGYVVPKGRVLKSSDPLRDYFWVSTHISFLDYFEEYFYPYFLSKRPGLTREELIREQGLRSIETYLRNSTKFGVITNENDFILSPADRDYLVQLFGDRARIYPTGGHLGNLEYRDNMEYMTTFFGGYYGEGGLYR